MTRRQARPYDEAYAHLREYLDANPDKSKTAAYFELKESGQAMRKQDHFRAVDSVRATTQTIQNFEKRAANSNMREDTKIRIREAMNLAGSRETKRGLDTMKRETGKKFVTTQTPNDIYDSLFDRHRGPESAYIDFY